jgi:hypothetical protein
MWKAKIVNHHCGKLFLDFKTQISSKNEQLSVLSDDFCSLKHTNEQISRTLLSEYRPVSDFTNLENVHAVQLVCWKLCFFLAYSPLRSAHKLSSMKQVQYCTGCVKSPQPEKNFNPGLTVRQDYPA